MSNVQLKDCWLCCTSPVICPYHPSYISVDHNTQKPTHHQRVQHGIKSDGSSGQRQIKDERKLKGLGHNWKLIYGHEGALASNIKQILEVSTLDSHRTAEKMCLKFLKTVKVNNLKTFQMHLVICSTFMVGHPALGSSV